MHQTHQRRFCRSIFLLGCILPTLAVLAWTTYERWPTTTSARLSELEHALDMRVVAARVTTPMPEVYRASGFELRNVETNAVVLTADVATLDHRGEVPQVELSGVKLAAEELALVSALVERTLSVDWPKQVVIEMTDLAWLGAAPAGASELLGEGCLVAKLTTMPHDESTASRNWSFQLGDSGVRLEVDRNRQITPPATRMVLDTAGASLPTRWIAELGAVVVDGGLESQFAGKVTITHTADGVTGLMEGSLDQVSLATAMQIPLQATASIDQLKLTWRDRRIESAEGLIEAGSGSMPGSLARLMQFLYDDSQLGGQVADDQTLEFQRLGTWFRLNNRALEFAGGIDRGNSMRAIMLGAEEQVLFGSPTKCAPLGDVATVLSWLGTEQADEVAAALPRAMRR
ncbi:hypothetical protein [Aeoliella mucimassa]|uniref:AsmA-like C-terminal domain-containing protein n=1 Tax=Aeoliella mucimassa TaxID=2527972 RepID=A0A518AKC9_9BACT|nr:hypothetical protein [Aeoliella mucimassa]QDU55190.1 hypothetical protein Pan181_13760 [Aeoliella mucimassa]